MKNLTRKKIFFLIIGLFILIFVTALTFTFGFGKVYERSIARFFNKKAPVQYSLKVRPEIKKITVKKTDADSCLEFTKDGIVREYDLCGGGLTDANRLTDSKNILKLFKLVQEKLLEDKDLRTKIDGSEGTVYELILETDLGSETLYILINNETSEDVLEVVETLNQIEQDIPASSASPSITVYPSASGTGNSTSPLPSQTNSSEPQASSGDNATLPTFTCEFIESGGKKKPVNVSNVICSSDPIPAQ